MIPRLNLQETLDQKYSDFLQALTHAPFTGEIRTDYGTRLITSTDNSIYQILPQAVVFPKTSEDVCTILQLARQERFQNLTFSPRGGGTGTNGQSLSPGIIVDCSKHMNRILEVNLEQGWVRVQPGVVLDQLNDHLKPYDVFFAPSLSPSNRATLGGMINTDACGKGSRIYGRTSDHVLELSCVFPDGTFWQSKEIGSRELELIEQREDIVGQIYREVNRIVTGKKDLIEQQFPKMSRFMTGYNLAKVVSKDQKRFNLNYLLAGSEGTLALITEAKLALTPLPKFKQLVVVKYRSFDDALGDAMRLLDSEPAAIETIDEKVLQLAKEDNVYHYVKDFIADEPEAPTRTVNLVEFTGINAQELDQTVRSLCEKIEQQKHTSNSATGFYATKNPSEISHLWSLRKKGVGLLGNAKGERKPIPFIEDTAVPPHNLAAYIQEFRAYLEEAGLEYGMFGHVDVGCLHVRPALDLKNLNDEKLVRELSDKIAQLVQKYGGVMWAEHGRGFRSEYTSMFFGEELYQDLRKIKGAFDERNVMNPGKIVTPLNSTAKSVKVEAPLRGHFDRQIPVKMRDEFELALNCNGNGACFNYDPNHVMCPSSKITRDRIHSPKGRAGMMREWLRQLGLASQPNEPNLPSKGRLILEDYFTAPLIFYRKLKNTIAAKRGISDFSREVYSAMDGCLSCKACSSQCPIHVDIPDMKSRFLEMYHTRYLRPLRDYLIATVEYTAPKQALFAQLSNRIMGWGLTKFVLQKFVGLIDAPDLSIQSVKEGLQHRHAPIAKRSHLEHLSPEEKKRSVILIPDVFTTYYESKLVLDIYDLLRMLGYVVYIAPFYPNGKPMHVKGFLKAFHTVAKKNVHQMEKLARAGVPIVGIEPSVVMTYRDEYLKILNRHELGFQVNLLQEWLTDQKDHLVHRARGMDLSDRTKYQLLGHCMEKTGALDSQDQWKQVFDIFHLDLDLIATGCCGMAGTFGHETANYRESKGVYAMSWSKHITPEPSQRHHILSTGYSCRTQINRFDGFKPLHPAQALLKELSQRNHDH